MQAGSAQYEALEQIRHACMTHHVASLAVPHGKAWRMCQSRLLGFDRVESKIRMHLPKPVWGTKPPKLRVGHRLGVRFASGDRRIMFMSAVAGFCYVYQGSARHVAMELTVASNVVTVNQREFYRVDVPADDHLEVIVWRAGMTQAAGEAKMPPVYRTRVCDLSVGGISICDLDGDTHWELGDHLGTALAVPGADDPLLLMAEVRRVSIRPDANAAYGLAFIGAETVRKTFYAQEILARAVSNYQRLHLQRRIKDT